MDGAQRIFSSQNMGWVGWGKRCQNPEGIFTPEAGRAAWNSLPLPAAGPEGPFTQGFRFAKLLDDLGGNVFQLLIYLSFKIIYFLR